LTCRAGSGCLLGGGYEHVLIDNISARLEHNYSDYGDDLVVGPQVSAVRNYHRHAVMAGLNFRF
jgi:outer membrane immunogenic protein